MIWDCSPNYSSKVGVDNIESTTSTSTSSCCNHVKCDEKTKKQVGFCKGVFKVTIVFLSFAGFLYQATDICTHYFSYRTVVYTNTEQDSVIDLPAVTFCLPTYFTKTALIDLYGVHISKSLHEAQRHQIHQQPNNNTNSNNNNNNNDDNNFMPNDKSMKNNSKINNKINDKINDKINEKINDKTDGKVNNSTDFLENMKSVIFESYQRQAFKDLPVIEILKKTIKIDDILECRLYYPPVVWLNVTSSKILDIMQYGIPCEQISSGPVESINGNGKCFTYFSQLDNEMSGHSSELYKVAVNRGIRYHSGRFVKLVVHFKTSDYASLPDSHKRECIQIHPPYKIPSEACLYTIHPGVSYDFVLVKTKSILQPPPYQTNCRSYHNSAQSQPKSQSDCIDTCMIETYQNACHCLPVHLTVWSNSSANLSLSVCDYDDFDNIHMCIKKEMSNYCYDKCKPDCIDRHYHVQVEKRVFPTQSQIDKAFGQEKQTLIKMRSNSAQINLWSDYQSDVTYIHTPSMSLIQLVCYLGGLAGLWLGVSVMTVSGWLAHIFPFLHKWNRNQRQVILQCQRHLAQMEQMTSQMTDVYSPRFATAWSQQNGEQRDEELPLFHHRPSMCSVSQLNAKF